MCDGRLFINMFSAPSIIISYHQLHTICHFYRITNSQKNASVQEAIDTVLKSHTFSREISAMEDEDTSSSDLGSSQVATHAGY